MRLSAEAIPRTAPSAAPARLTVGPSPREPPAAPLTSPAGEWVPARRERPAPARQRTGRGPPDQPPQPGPEGEREWEPRRPAEGNHRETTSACAWG